MQIEHWVIDALLSRGIVEASASTDEKSYTHILTETKGKVGLITLNRPKALNALCSDLFTEINDALRSYDNNDNIGAVVITGSKKAFAGNVVNAVYVSML